MTNDNNKNANMVFNRVEAMLQKRFDEIDTSQSETIDTLIKELKTRQVELELQNEELRRAQAELGTSHQRFRELYDLAPVGYFSLDKNCRILDVNMAAAQMIGTYRTKLINRQLRQYIFSEDRTLFDDFADQLISHGKTYSCDIRLATPGDQTVFARMNGRLFESDLTHMFVTLTDITEQKRAESELARMRDELGDRVRLRTAELSETVKALEKEIEERKIVEDKLRQSEENMRQMSHKTMWMMENDRKNVAKEVHDSIGGSLAAIKFRLEDVLNKSPENGEITQAMQQSIENIQDTIKETKRISAGLRPTTLDDLGLLATIKWYCRHLMESSPEISLVTKIEIDEEEIDEAQKITLYRIIQEAMSNAVGHSEADTIWLTLQQPDTSVTLEVKDNGCGFDMENVFSETHEALVGYGLNSIRERSEISGGTFRIESFENAGTNVYVTLPKQI
ncbi:MAG: ATP-binding protein [Thermodesulfobacteriota bacterium]